jgi:acetyltransferase-like isoleucine patch superfamily enzyme
VRDRIGTERRRLEYFKPHGFFGTVIKSARMHGYFGVWNVIRFFIMKTNDYMLSLIAYFSPYNGIRIFCHRRRGVKIGKRVLIGFHCVLDEIFPDFITIEDDVSLAGKVYVLTHSNPYEYYQGKIRSYVAPVVIKKNAWITVNVTILPGVTIGEGSVISAGSVVSRNIPDHVVAGGNPAQVLKELRKREKGNEDSAN